MILYELFLTKLHIEKVIMKKYFIAMTAIYEKTVCFCRGTLRF